MPTLQELSSKQLNSESFEVGIVIRDAGPTSKTYPTSNKKTKTNKQNNTKHICRHSGSYLLSYNTANHTQHPVVGACAKHPQISFLSFVTTSLMNAEMCETDSQLDKSLSITYLILRLHTLCVSSPLYFINQHNSIKLFSTFQYKIILIELQP